MKPDITLTLDRKVERPAEDPIRLAVTLNVWASREQADIEDAAIKAALAKASTQLAADLFGREPAPPVPRCGDCRFLGRAVDHSGECRRHAPVVLANDVDRCPSVSLDFWCGEFQPGMGAP